MEQIYIDTVKDKGYSEKIADIFQKWESVKDEILLHERKEGTGKGTIHIYLGQTCYSTLKSCFPEYFKRMEAEENVPDSDVPKITHFFLRSNVISMLGFTYEYLYSQGYTNAETTIRDIMDSLKNNVSSVIQTTSLFKLSTGGSQLRPYFKKFDSNGAFVNVIRKILVPDMAYQISIFKNNNNEYAAIWQLGFSWMSDEQTNVFSSLIRDNIARENCQQIFYGAPGTGKSHYVDKETTEDNSIRTTFHPDSDYASFVGCYKPTKERSSFAKKQPILDYDSLVDKFKEYLNVPDVNITKACTMFGFDYHDSIVNIQNNGHRVMGLVNDAYKSNTTYDSVVRGGMACYENLPFQNDVKIIYDFIPQAFLKAYVEAWKRYLNPSMDENDKKYFLVIEEINRGNCAQIFGDLFQLLDRARNGFSSYAISPDSDIQKFLKEDAEKGFANVDFHDLETEIKIEKGDEEPKNIAKYKDIKNGDLMVLPPNLYIWATMNTSDQSLFPIDSAFKRRWDWKYMKIKDAKKGWQIDYRIDSTNEEEKKYLGWFDFVKQINAIVADMTSSADKQLGYFFCKPDKKINPDDTDLKLISMETFVGKVVFYLWNDVFKDYGFDDASLFKYIGKDENGKDVENDLTFPDFYNDDDNTVNAEMAGKFIDNVMAWDKYKQNNND